VQEQQALIILQKIIQHQIILATLIKIAHLTEIAQALAIQRLLPQEVVQRLALLEVVDLLAAEDQERVVVNNGRKNARLNNSIIV